MDVFQEICSFRIICNNKFSKKVAGISWLIKFLAN